jgi:hypothetical protein
MCISRFETLKPAYTTYSALKIATFQILKTEHIETCYLRTCLYNKKRNFRVTLAEEEVRPTLLRMCFLILKFNINASGQIETVVIQMRNTTIIHYLLFFCHISDNKLVKKL